MAVYIYIDMLCLYTVTARRHMRDILVSLLRTHLSLSSCFPQSLSSFGVSSLPVSQSTQKSHRGILEVFLNLSPPSGYPLFLCHSPPKSLIAASSRSSSISLLLRGILSSCVTVHPKVSSRHPRGL